MGGVSRRGLIVVALMEAMHIRVGEAQETLCPESFAYDELRERCVPMTGWCDGRLWTCGGKPESHRHPYFICDPERWERRPSRCCRVWWPPQDGITPEGAKGKGRCWKHKPRHLS
jgi:hypothetical protein